MLETHGAHSTSIRLIAHGNAASISNTSSLLFDSETVVNSKAHCAERSLGGTDAGLTSGSIDSLLSVSFLLELPKEIAFRLYQSALPSAIGNRDCSRTLALSSIGSYLGVGVYYSGDQFSWRTQQRFIDQCNDLSRNATWWNIFSFYDVSFDPSVFSKPMDSSTKETMQSYCEQLVWKATNKLGPGAARARGPQAALGALAHGRICRAALPGDRSVSIGRHLGCCLGPRGLGGTHVGHDNAFSCLF